MSDYRYESRLEMPRVYIANMLVFVAIVGVLVAVMFRGIKAAFMANPGLNGLIVAVLIVGILYTFRMVLRLRPEVRWVNAYRVQGPAGEVTRGPVLLEPMAMQLGQRAPGTVLSPTTMRALLDSIAARLDESRDISRYIVSLLIFLGLLGTFWGLLATVSSMGALFHAMDVTSEASFSELMAGLEKPLEGMGLSFSSSLFGLAGSLIMGFLDLQASQAQNRFYNQLENWLSTFTEIDAGDGAQPGVAQGVKMDIYGLQKGMDRLTRNFDALMQERLAGSAAQADSLDRLADAVAGIVEQMREEQKITRGLLQQAAGLGVDVPAWSAPVVAPAPAPPPGTRPTVRPAPRTRS